ncbi:hypothetical protein QR680_008502 [Steinernema hermaphroditum]|uniref:Serpentine receptor class gamma n=1 Tax=Steinernema hermaphroditum TaxID=289476 RepID=A0AA39M7Z1_9BILA|nr:hypothetical protein QR680_008502 [Steinernema hermaphroditum]
MKREVIMLCVSLLYGIPSFLLYLIVLVQLIRPTYRKRFNNPFFRLCFLIGVVDCIGYLDYYLFFTLPAYSLFSSFYGSSLFSPSAFTTAIYFSNYLFSYLQLFGNCFLTVNRFTCIVFPLKHNRIWKYFFPLSVVITKTSGTAAKNRRAELNLFFLALVMFLLQCIGGLLQVLIYVAIKANNDMMLTVLYTLLPWLSDLKFLSPPWVLVVISTSIRETVIQALPKRLLQYHNHWMISGSSVTVTSVSVRSLNVR